MDKEETLKVIREYLYGNFNISELERKKILKLYSIYLKLRKIKENSGNSLSSLENEIYDIEDYNNKYISDIDKIKIETLYYDDYDKINNKNTKIDYISVQEKVDFIKKSLNQGVVDQNDILELKKKIVEIQFMTNNNITFLEAAYQLFEMYYDEMEKAIKSKKK